MLCYKRWSGPLAMSLIAGASCRGAPMEPVCLELEIGSVERFSTALQPRMHLLPERELIWLDSAVIEGMGLQLALRYAVEADGSFRLLRDSSVVSDAWEREGENVLVWAPLLEDAGVVMRLEGLREGRGVGRLEMYYDASGDSVASPVRFELVDCPVELG